MLRYLRLNPDLSNTKVSIFADMVLPMIWKAVKASSLRFGRVPMHIMILRAISSLMATRDSFTLTITFPFRDVMTVAVPPTTKPRFSRCFFTSGLPPILLITDSSPGVA